MRSKVLGLMFLLRELGFFFVMCTDDSKTQVPSFFPKKGSEKSEVFPTRKFFFCIDNA